LDRLLIELNSLDEIPIIIAPGSVAGYNTDLAFELKSKIGIAVLRTTTFNPPTARLLEQLAATVGK
jgi:hypothetical protein